MNHDKQDPNGEWYLASGGKEYGPVGIEVLRSGLDTGAIVPSDLVWTPGLPEWTQIADLVSPNPAGAKSSGTADGILKRRATANRIDGQARPKQGMVHCQGRERIWSYWK